MQNFFEMPGKTFKGIALELYNQMNVVKLDVNRLRHMTKTPGEL